MAVFYLKAFAGLVHQIRIHCHVAHAAAAIKLDAVEAVLGEPLDVALVVDSPPTRGFSLLDAATTIKVPD